jgi:glycosyltransferase involved in cell wall biosynthesis
LENLSIVIITKNESGNLKTFLPHLSWAGEIITVDDNSSDETCNILKEYKNVKIFTNTFTDFSSQRNFGIRQASNEWILSLDPDEVVSEKLKTEIRSGINQKEFSAFNIPTKNIFYGKWLKYGGNYPDYHIRLFKKENAVWDNPVHERLLIKGKTGTFREPIEHYGHRTIEETLEKLNKYTTFEARIRTESGIRFSAFRAVFEPLKVFLSTYFYRLGFMDGYPGFVYCFFFCCYRLFTWAKIYQTEKK